MCWLSLLVSIIQCYTVFYYYYYYYHSILTFISSSIAAANIGNKSQEPTAPKSSDVCNYVKTLRKQLSMDYRLSHEMPADRPTKGAKSIKDGGNYVACDEIVIKVTKPCEHSKFHWNRTVEPSM